jgi:rare lipoprotein A
VEHGQASWYGPGFHGRRTANGEKFDQNGVSAAHKTLPFGTVLRVHNLDNGKTLDVRVNDRGPFVAGRIVDLSKGAARQLDLIRSGVAPVRVEVLQWPEHLVPNPDRRKHRAVQVASFREHQRARQLARDLEHDPDLQEEVVVERARPWHRVRIRRVSLARLDAVLTLLRSRGFEPLVLDP